MQRMPVLFVGHGSPMNAIDDNEWSRGFQKLGRMLPEAKLAGLRLVPGSSAIYALAAGVLV